MNELTEILIKFSNSGWDLISKPSSAWLVNKCEKATLMEAICQADQECGSCGCEFDPLYKRALVLLDSLA